MFATIINIPSDQPTIQQGINIASANDTILIADGTYYENLQIIGKEIMLASWFIIDADSSHIGDTIIDGSAYTSADEASVIAFLPGDNPSAVPRIIGLTLINGFGWKVEETIQEVTIEKKVGGGLFIRNLSPVFSHNEIKNNAVEDEGGGGYVLNGNPNFGGVIIHEGNWNWGRAINPGGNVFLNNYAGTGKTFFADSIAVTDTIFAENCHFDVYSSADSDVSDYWATSEGEFSFLNGSGENEAIITDVYVSPTGNDSLNTGLSAASPFQHIWFALSQVYADSLNPVTIHLAGGTYSPTANDEQFPLQISDYISLTGDQSRDETILDAEYTDRVIIISAVEEANLQTLTIRNGLANPGTGGGIYCENSSGSLENLLVEHCSAQNSGGGIGCYNFTGTLYELRIENNISVLGGGIIVVGPSPDIESVEIRYNSAPFNGGGGGMAIMSADPTIENAIIEYNFAQIGGGILCGPFLPMLPGSDPYLKNVIITNNADMGFNYYSNWPVSGAGIFLGSSNPVLENVTVSNNMCGISSPENGAIYCGFLWHPSDDGSNPTIINSIVSNTENGCGIWADYSSMNYGESEIAYSDFYNNEWGNFCYDNPELGMNVTTNANGDSCDVYYNIQMKPCFVDSVSDFHLTEDSPCIDAGDPAYPFDPDETVVDMGMYYFHQTAPDTPENVIVEIIAGTIFISWDEVPDADSYSLYSSEDPYLAFENWTQEESEITGLSWSEPVSGSNKFYFVKAVN